MVEGVREVRLRVRVRVRGEGEGCYSTALSSLNCTCVNSKF